MKKFVSLILVILLTVGCMYSLASCGNLTLPKVPDGYKRYHNGYISFCYPEGWGRTIYRIYDVIKSPKHDGDNIIVTYEDETDDEDYEPSYSYSYDGDTLTIRLGGNTLKFSDFLITEGVVNDTNIVRISYYMGEPQPNVHRMRQNIIVTKVEDRTFMVIISEINYDDSLADTIVDTFCADRSIFNYV